ncbi:hypothetical protein BGW80DRAFT_1565473 [Lactifluus volemus]|nr:hypothetical protein BGW80DRAFT_1568040 [Lactifluus volemus]KAH9957164.1 hypothetical protein BGW80DRAFT_1565473 [Lactifluus volemus]
MPEEAANCRVFKGSEATKTFQFPEKDLLKRYPDWLDLFTQTPCTGITPPTTTTPLYTIQTPRGTVMAYHIIHATNGWTPHLLLRGNIIPIRSLVTAQQRGTNLSTLTGTLAHTIFHMPPGFDYLGGEAFLTRLWATCHW